MLALLDISTSYMQSSKQNIAQTPLIIAGLGRSGTTWILDSLAEANGLATLFEPLHPNAVPHAKFFSNRYVRDDSYEPELSKFMDKVFSGDLRSVWAKYRVRPDSLLPYFDRSAPQSANSEVIFQVNPG